VWVSGTASGVHIGSVEYQGLEQLQYGGTEYWRLIYVEKWNNNFFKPLTE